MTADAADALCATTACPAWRWPRPPCQARSPYRGRVILATELLHSLYVTTPGTSLHLDNDSVHIYHPDQPQVRRLPLVRINHIVAFGGVTITDDLMHRCTADHRSVTWLTGTGRFLARA